MYTLPNESNHPGSSSLMSKLTQAETELEQRVAALEIGNKYDATKVAIAAREAEMLETLRQIKSAMAAEGGGRSSSSTEVEQLKSENEKLKEMIDKQQYRIQHVVAAMEAMLSGRKK
jgi:gamma-glutamyl:cysteine ligase YbdK (ATP-grasp superfamily)